MHVHMFGQCMEEHVLAKLVLTWNAFYGHGRASRF